MSLDIYLSDAAGERVHSQNITHNLNTMAEHAGLYKPLWDPEGVGITHARQLIGPLRRGLADMILRPDDFRQFDPPNKWGSYDGFVPWLLELLLACEQHPNATVEVWA
jgi:hypothetical protein